MTTSSLLVKGWHITVIETKDFKGIITKDCVYLIGLRDRDIYGIFPITNNGLVIEQAFYNLLYRINYERKEIIISFTFD